MDSILMKACGETLQMVKYIYIYMIISKAHKASRWWKYLLEVFTKYLLEFYALLQNFLNDDSLRMTLAYEIYTPNIYHP